MPTLDKTGVLILRCMCCPDSLLDKCLIGAHGMEERSLISAIIPVLEYRQAVLYCMILRAHNQNKELGPNLRGKYMCIHRRV